MVSSVIQQCKIVLVRLLIVFIKLFRSYEYFVLHCFIVPVIHHVFMMLVIVIPACSKARNDWIYLFVHIELVI